MKSSDQARFEVLESGTHPITWDDTFWLIRKLKQEQAELSRLRELALGDDIHLTAMEKK